MKKQKGEPFFLKRKKAEIFFPAFGALEKTMGRPLKSRRPVTFVAR